MKSAESVAADDNNPYVTEYYADADKAPGITSLTIPATVESIDPAFFQLFPNASAITVDPANSVFTSYNGMLFGTDDAGDPTDLLLVPEGMEGAAVLPDSLASVPACVFSRCLKLSAIEIPTGGTVSARFATRNGILYTSDLTTLIAAPAGLGASATVASECAAIAEGAFWGNTALRHIIAPGKVASIAMIADDASIAAFNEEAIGASTVTTVDRTAWEAAGFTAFTDPAQPGEGALPSEGEAGLAFTLLADHTLSVYWQGESLTIPDIEIPAQAEVGGATYAVSEIADNAFRGQSELAWIRIPAGVTRIGQNAFDGCSGLAAVDIPSSVTTIDQGAFSGCEALEEVQMSAGLRTIGSDAFRSAGIKQIVLPAGVDSVGDAAFANCRNLATVLALGNAQYVSPSALQGDNGVNIYTPFREDGDYAWTAGAPGSGNHLLPYGAKASEDALVLAVGESADLFTDEGYAYAPAEATLEFSYKAATVSVDADGVVVGKQPGITTVDALVKWNGITLATAMRLVKVTHTPEATEEADPTGNSASAATSADPSATEDEQVAPRPDIFQAEMPLTTPVAQEHPEMIAGEYQLGSDGEKAEVVSGEFPVNLRDEDEKPEDVIDQPAIKDPEGFTAYQDSEAGNDNEEISQSGAGDGVQPVSETSEEDAESEEGLAVIGMVNTLASALSTTSTEARASDTVTVKLDIEGKGNREDITFKTSNVRTNLYANGGVLTSFYINGTGHYTWGQTCGNGDNHVIPGTLQTSSASLGFGHRGGFPAGGNSSARTGFFHTLCTENSAFDQTSYNGITTHNGNKLYKRSVVANRTGYGFDHWAVGSAAGRKYPTAGVDNPEKNTYSAAGLNLYAVWTPNDYQISFDPNGGSGSMANQSMKYDTSAKLSENRFSRNGYTFGGWKTASGAPYSDRASVINLTAQHNGVVTLYAQWNPIQYTLTFKANGGNFSGSAADQQRHFYITTDGITFPSYPTRAGWDFVGWIVTGDLVTSGKGSGISGFIAGVPRYVQSFSSTGWWGNATFVAAWRSTLTINCAKPTDSPSGTNNANQYIYFYNYDSTTNFFSKTGEYGTALNNIAKLGTTAGTRWIAASSMPTATCYTLKGFYTASSSGSLCLNNSGNLSSTIASISGNTMWYAQWNSAPYSITLDPNGGTMPSGKNTTITYTKGQADVPFYSTSSGVSDYAPSRSDATFVGWRCVRYDSTITDSWATGGKPYSNFYTSTSQYGNYELRAVWYYRITLNGNAPSAPQSTTVTQSRSTIYYYPDYGYRTSIATAGNSWPTSGFLLPDRTDQPVVLSTVPTCSDSNWVFAGYYPSRRSTNLADSPGEICIASGGQLYPHIEPAGNTTWYAAWKGATYTITLQPNPSGSTGATQSKTTTIQYVYGLHYTYSSATRSLVYWLPDCANNAASGSAIEVPIPTKAGWTFAGYYNGSTKWYDACSLSNHASRAKHLESVTNTICPSGNFTLTAKWVRDITLNANTGTMPGGGSTTTMQIEFGKTLPSNLSSAQTPVSPTGITWIFDGYYSAATGGTTYYSYAGARMYNSAITGTAPATLYAHWRRFVTVQFNNDNNGVTASPLDRLHIIKGTTPPSITAQPVQTGYTLVGYYTQPQGGTKMYDRDGNRLAVATDISIPETLWAQWEPDVQISFHVENGYFQQDGQQVDTLSYDLSPSLGVCPTLYPRTSDGYTFDGWYDAGGSKLSSTQNWAPSRPASGWVEGTVYTAKFKPIVYTITYRCSICGEIDNNAATNACKHIHDLGDLPKQFTIEDIEREDGFWIGPIAAMNPGYCFVGWEGTLESDNDEGSSRVPIASLGNKTLIARVVVNTYRLTLDAGDGTWAQADPSGFTAAEGSHTATRSFTVETAAFVLPQPELPGYSFSHWECDGEEFSGTFTPGPSHCSNKTFIAVWSADPYQITYQLDDELGTGTLPEGEKNPYTYSADSPALELPIPVRIGYDFLGWTEESVSDEGRPSITGADPQIDAMLPAGSWGNRQYKAHWRPYRYNVAFDLAGGEWDKPQPSNPIEATYDQDVSMPAAPKRAGYFFTGWQVAYETATGTVIEDLDAGMTVPRANWVAVEGEPAREGVPENKGAVVHVVALWTANLSFEVAAGAEGVHMGIAKKAMSEEPFELTAGTATLRNLSDGPLKVVEVEPSSVSDYNALKAEALQLFRQESNLQQAAFTVRPSRGSASWLQIGRFGIADSASALTLIDDMGYGSTTPNCARNWFMEPTGTYGDELSLVYQLDMGALGLADVDLTRDASLHVADLKYTVALIQ